MSSTGVWLLVFAVCLLPGDSRFIIDPLSVIKQEISAVDLCPECSQILRLSANMISSSDAKATVYETLHALCRRLPGEQSTECDLQVKSFLPKVLQQAPGHLKPEELCMVFGLCSSHKEEKPHKLPQSFTDTEISTSVGGAVQNQELFSPVCTLCLFFIKKLETLLPKNMTQDKIKKVMEEFCDLVPKSYQEQCDDFVEKYGADIVEFLVSSAAPHTICMLLHLCLFDEQPVPEVTAPSDCDSCRTLAALSRVHLGLNATGSQTSAFLQSVCIHHPKAIPKCNAFTRTYGSQLQSVLGNQMKDPHVCETADLCSSTKELEPFGNNPCARGPSYWCKTIKTAQKCGNQVFCEKHIWKN
ncbi:unnamed protein product [Menidia menidia]|uniref:(Atlantic silverside) hypothetical protein n=1 Tax=Menidia menidia TaxID=238744 RepID=A0A8S4BAE9_9TELE|nr:unnamed protein product [Menidia menidia]